MKDLVSTRNNEKIKPINGLKSAEASTVVVLGSVKYLCKITVFKGFSLCLLWWCFWDKSEISEPIREACISLI